MDWERQAIIKKVYLSAVAEHAQRIAEVAKKLQTAQNYRDAQTQNTDEYRGVIDGELSLEDANLVDHELSISTLRDIEKALEDAKYSLACCYEV